MKNRLRLLGALLGAVTATFSIFAPAWAENIVIEHVSGSTEVPANPQKVVVFDLASLDNLTRLDIRTIVGVPQTPLPAYLKQYGDERYTKVGTLFEPDYETIAALQPDLIVIAGRSQPKYKELSRIAPTIDLTVSNDHYLEEVKRNVTILGNIFGKQKEARAEIANLEKSIADLRQQAVHQGNGLLIMTTGGKMSAYGPGSRFSLLHSAFGVIPAAPSLSVSNHGQPISPEFILETNSDWLFVIDRDAAIGATGKSASQLLDNVIVNQTNAARKSHIVYLDPQNWYLIGGGLSGLHETIDQINQAYKNVNPGKKWLVDKKTQQ